MSLIVFKDFLTFKIEQDSLSLKDSTGITSSGKRVIFPRIAATHAGRITGNYGFYLPQKMEQGVSTFTSPYPKPVLLHHKDNIDPIGRIINGRYIDTSTKLKDSWNAKKLKDSQRPISDSLLDAFCKGKLSDRENIDIVDKYFFQDFEVIEDPSYEGLGYAEIIAAISDQDAVEKILDKRYLTGSIGASTNSATCSVCKKDWGKDSKCDHEPGKIYDNKKRCILIAGDLTFHEYSFVNDPADHYSRVIEIVNGESHDFVTVHDSTKERIPEIGIFFEDSKRYTNDIIILSDIQQQKTEYNNTQAIKDSKEDLHTMLFKHALELARKNEQLASQVGLEDAVKELVDSQITEDKLIEALLLKFPVEEKVADSTEVSESTTSQQVQDSVPTIESFADRSDEQLIQLADTIILAVKERKLECSASKEAKESTDKLQDEIKSLNQQIEALKKDVAGDQTLKDKDREIGALKRELKYVYSDVDLLQDELLKSQQETKDTKVSRIADYALLSDPSCDIQKIKDDLSKKTTLDVEEELKTKLTSVDLLKIVDKIKSGITQEPIKTVEDPTLKIKDNEVQKTDVNIDAMTKIRQKCYSLKRKVNGQLLAERFLDECKQKGLIPEGYPVDSFLK